jgi:hypothetical protein
MPVVQHAEYVPALAICHTTMQVRLIRLSVYRRAALHAELHQTAADPDRNLDHCVMSSGLDAIDDRWVSLARVTGSGANSVLGHLG